MKPVLCNRVRVVVTVKTVLAMAAPPILLSWEGSVCCRECSVY
jgi:hypothetical protein